MRILGRSYLPGLLALGAGILLAGCRRDEVTVYDAPKEQVPMPAAAPMASQGVQRAQVAAPHWVTPQGWQELAPTEMRVGNMIVPGNDGKKAEVTIIPFPGTAGTEVDNVNRWRMQLGLPPVTADKVTSENVNIGPDAGKIYEIESADKEIVAADLERDGTSWFFKISGDKATVDGAKTAFGEFLKSVSFEQSAAAAPAPESAAQAPAAPTDKGMPTWDIPANWHEQEANAKLLKSFAITDASGHKATATISTLAGDGGGVLQNMNRWRGQLGLQPLEETDLENMASFVEVMGGKATVLDMLGTNAKTGQPGRIVGAVVPRDDSTWFYKLTGDEEIVGKEKPAFIKFVQGVRY